MALSRRTAFLSAVLALSGCAEVTSVELSARTAPPLGGVVDPDRVEVVEGTAIGLRIALLSDNQLILPSDAQFEVADDVALITPVDAVGNYLISGSVVGETVIFASAALHDGELEIPVTVVEQPPLD